MDFDWELFYRFAKKQALLGVVFDGVQRLPKEVAPKQDLLMTWFGQYQKIRMRNMLLNEATVKIYKKIKAEGLRCCILKGQGNALAYHNPYARIPGDVDVWVNAPREEIRQLAVYLIKGNGTIGKESLNHIEMSVNGIAVELHSTPAILNNPIYNRRLQKWLNCNADLQCSNVVSLPDDMGDVAVPTVIFNVVYQLFHLYHHYLFEGIGLRQFVDYYFVISNVRESDDLLANLHLELKHFGLYKFAGAVMYVLYEVLGLAEDKMIVPMDVKRGKLLLEEVIQGGNFGKYDERYGFGRGVVGHNMQRLFRDLRLVRYYPAESLSEPVFRTWHFLWRMWNK